MSDRGCKQGCRHLLQVAATLLLLLATLSLALAAPPTITALGAEEQSLEADHCLLCLKFSEKYLEYIADIISGG